MIYTPFFVISSAVTVLTMTTQLQHSDSLHSSSLPVEIITPSDNSSSTGPERGPTKAKQKPQPTLYPPQEVSEPSTGIKDSVKGSLLGSEFYMCCQANPNSITIDHYYPPYACIFGPRTGLCPQGINSSFIFPWLCTAEAGWGVGQIVRGSEIICCEDSANICTQTCNFNLSR